MVYFSLVEKSEANKKKYWEQTVTDHSVEQKHTHRLKMKMKSGKW